MVKRCSYEENTYKLAECEPNAVAGHHHSKIGLLIETTALPFLHDPTRLLPLLQDKPRDHSFSGDGICPLTTVIAERRGLAARARHRRDA
jgi:hypothetical protein